MRRFIASCLEGTPYKSFDKLFRAKIHPLYEPRWGEVYKFCSKLHPLLKVLRKAWNAAAYARRDAATSAGDEQGNCEGEEDDQRGDGLGAKDGWQPSQLTEVLQDKMFLSFCGMVLKLDELVQYLAAWAEQCPCHGHLQSAYGEKRVPRFVLESEFGRHAAGNKMLRH